MWGDIVGIIGMIVMFLLMFFCLWIDDYGFYIYKEDLVDDDKEVKM